MRFDNTLTINAPVGEVFAYPARPEHVAMAIGQGLLVQAPHTGAVVDVVEAATHGTLLTVRRAVTG